MKNNVVVLMFVLFSQFTLAADGSTTFPEVNILGSQVRDLHSATIEQPYKLWISLPAGYDVSKQDYPVIYLLDAQWDFTLMISLYGQLRADGDIPNAILVGVTWGGENPNVDALRMRDFLPIVKNPATDIHGAQNFLTFFEDELFPFIEKEYRVTEQRTLVGSSFAGWFSVYAMFQRPDLFSGFIATAPTVDLKNEILLELADKFSTRVKKDHTRLYVAVGKRDGNHHGAKKLLSFLDANNFKGLSYKTEFFDDLGHSSIKGNGNTRGLQYVFKKGDVRLTQAQLQTLTGRYKQLNSEQTAVVSIQNEQLVVSVQDNFEIPLKATGPNTFYFASYGVEVVFNLENSTALMEINISNQKDTFERE